MRSTELDIPDDHDDLVARDETAQRLLNLLFILNASTTPIGTEAIVSDSDLGYGSGNRESDLRKFRRDRERLAQQGFVIDEIRPNSAARTEESTWLLDRQRTFATTGLISAADAALLIRALDTYARSGAQALAQPVAAIRRKAVEAMGHAMGELPAQAEPQAPTADPLADAAWYAFSMRRAIAFRYRNAAGEARERTLAIYGIFAQEGNTYLTGWDSASRSLRTFRCDRIDRILGLGEAYEVPASFDIHDQLFLPFDFAPGTGQQAVFTFPAVRTALELAQITRGRGELDRDAKRGWIWCVDVRDFDAAAAFALGHAREGMRPAAPDDLVDAWFIAIGKVARAHAR